MNSVGEPQHRRNAAPQAAGAPRPRGVPARRDPAKPPMVAIIDAVEEMREDLPRIGVGGLCLQFRCRGEQWSAVTREDVRIALAVLECAARREFPVPARRRAIPRTPEGAWPQFQRAVAELHAGGAGEAGLVRRLGELGWQRVSEGDVARALRRIKAANTARHLAPGRPLPAPARSAPGLCPSCDTHVTDLGRCRCS